MIWRTLVVMALLGFAACSEDESHFLDCGPGTYIQDNNYAYCVYAEHLVDEGFQCPPGSLARIDIDGAVVCTNAPEVDTALELPSDVCDALQSDSCGSTEMSFSLTAGQDWDDVEESQRISLLWVREAPNPDAAFFYGDGSLHNSRADIRVPTKLPHHALHAELFGVGIIMVTDATFEATPGQVPPGFF